MPPGRGVGHAVEGPVHRVAGLARQAAAAGSLLIDALRARVVHLHLEARLRPPLLLICARVRGVPTSYHAICPRRPPAPCSAAPAAPAPHLRTRLRGSHIRSALFARVVHLHLKARLRPPLLLICARVRGVPQIKAHARVLSILRPTSDSMCHPSTVHLTASPWRGAPLSATLPAFAAGPQHPWSSCLIAPIA